jgi:four helix bundle protein
MNARHFRELRAWQAAYAFKLRIYDLLEQGPISRDEKIHKQLREASASAPGQIAEGFGRFDPVDFARFVKMARASLMECQNHLQDAVDRHHITEQVREEHDQLAGEALKEIAGLIDYLHSPEAKRNAERIRQKRQERRRRNTEQRNQEQRNPEQRNPEPRNSEQRNPEQRNSERKNSEP